MTGDGLEGEKGKTFIAESPDPGSSNVAKAVMCK
jgi:hypothetical protein